jgi:hypothetical protein
MVVVYLLWFYFWGIKRDIMYWWHNHNHAGVIVDSPQLNFYQTTSWFSGAIRGSNVFIFNLRGCNESWAHGCGDCRLLSLYDSIWIVVIMWASRETFKAKAWVRDRRRQWLNDKLYMRILKLIVFIAWIALFNFNRANLICIWKRILFESGPNTITTTTTTTTTWVLLCKCLFHFGSNC